MYILNKIMIVTGKYQVNLRKFAMSHDTKILNAIKI